MEVNQVLTVLQGISLSFFSTSGGRNIEKLKCFNRLLSAVLQEYKGRCEGLSMQLGQLEAEATALHLALQYRSVHPTHDVTDWEGNGHPQRMALVPRERQGPHTSLERGRALTEKYFSLTRELNFRRF